MSLVRGRGTSVYSTAKSELHVYDETPNRVNFVMLSLTELYLQHVMQVSS